MTDKIIETQYDITKKSRLLKFYEKNKILLFSGLLILIIFFGSFSYYLTIKKNKKIYLNFDDENSIHGIGWTHNRLSTKKGIWTEGNISNLIFKLEGNIDDNFTIRIKLSSIITKKNESLNFNVNINNSFIKEFNVKNINELNEESIFINLNKNNIKDDIIYIKFEIKNPVTKLELLKSPDARKLGILVESLEIINN